MWTKFQLLTSSNNKWSSTAPWESFKYTNKYSIFSHCIEKICMIQGQLNSSHSTFLDYKSVSSSVYLFVARAWAKQLLMNPPDLRRDTLRLTFFSQTEHRTSWRTLSKLIYSEAVGSPVPRYRESQNFGTVLGDKLSRGGCRCLLFCIFFFILFMLVPFLVSFLLSNGRMIGANGLRCMLVAI